MCCMNCDIFIGEMLTSMVHISVSETYVIFNILWYRGRMHAWRNFSKSKNRSGIDRTASLSLHVNIIAPHCYMISMWWHSPAWSHDIPCDMLSIIHSSLASVEQRISCRFCICMIHIIIIHVYVYTLYFCIKYGCMYCKFLRKRKELIST